MTSFKRDFNYDKISMLTLTVSITGSYCSSLTLNGESKPHTAGTYTYKYTAGTTISYSYSTQGGSYNGSIVLDEDKTLTINTSSGGGWQW